MEPVSMDAKRKTTCGAKTRSGRPCGRTDLGTGGRCKLHGGKSAPAGPAHHSYRTGRYSQFLPKGLRERYDAAMADPELFDLRGDIGLLAARLIDRLTDMDAAESELWKELVGSVEQLDKARTAGDMEQFGKIVLDMRRQIRQGAESRAAWNEVRSLIRDRKDLIESERKRMVEMHQMVSVERFFVLIDAIIFAIRQHVTDQTALQKISTEVSQLLGNNGMARLTAADPVAG